MLFLHVVIADERDVAPNRPDGGQNLPDLVADIRLQIGDSVRALANFNESLLEAGWLDSHALHYESRRWAVRKERTFQVRPGFPRLVEADLPTGVGNVSYGLTLSVCGNFELPLTEALELLRGNPTE